MPWTAQLWKWQVNSTYQTLHCMAIPVTEFNWGLPYMTHARNHSWDSGTGPKVQTKWSYLGRKMNSDSDESKGHSTVSTLLRVTFSPGKVWYFWVFSLCGVLMLNNIVWLRLHMYSVAIVFTKDIVRILQQKRGHPSLLNHWPSNKRPPPPEKLDWKQLKTVKPEQIDSTKLLNHNTYSRNIPRNTWYIWYNNWSTTDPPLVFS